MKPVKAIVPEREQCLHADFSHFRFSGHVIKRASHQTALSVWAAVYALAAILDRCLVPVALNGSLLSRTRDPPSLVPFMEAEWPTLVCNASLNPNALRWLLECRA